MQASAQTAPVTSAEVASRVKAGLTSLKDLSISDPKELDDSEFDQLINALLRLRAQKSGYMELHQASLSSKLLGADFKTKASGWPTDLIDAFVAQAKYFDELVLTRDEVKAFAWRADAIVAQKTGLENKAADAEVSKRAPQVITALSAVVAKTANTVDEAERARASLSGILTTPAKLDVLKGHAESVPKLAALRDLLSPFSTRTGNRVHVISALYGDINAINQLSKTTAPTSAKKHHRWCIASATVAKSCERQRSCSLTAIADFRTGICSYDPAPFLEKAYKALVVWYVCRPNLNEANWSDPSNRSTDRFDPVPTRQARFAVLYSKDQSFDCTGPVDQ